ncbi:MAG: beta-ketoacyl-[acyl-carrier-protein] synthase family protein [Acidobacteriota bacterium]|nr:beta-ketoacyl-[acyl-carrier-protein] synthase family protein [Bryobacteraceae bacterium CoA2 C42]MCA2964976.1 beta-ketoacyl-[acyl-carrier-protein] synthase family protein [Acidobacteriaceae bacterium]
MQARRVVITGLGVMSPNGLGREPFWRACLAGTSGVRRISRFDPDGFSVQIAGEITDFDEAAWTDPKERPHVSRATPLARAAAGEALAHAGLDTSRMTRDQLREIGIVLGSGGGSQEWTEQQYRHWYAGEHKQCSVYVIPTSTIGTLASEVSMYFGLRGMSHIISTGCTSSTDAIGYAFRQIQCGMIDCMLAGGVDAPLAPLILRGFQLMRIMTQRWNHEPHRGSRPFSGDRDGFVLGEGAWMFVLEEREHALCRGAAILGEISGYGSTCEAYHRVRLEECGEEPARTMQMALREADLAPEAVQYVHYHGTSTQLNDRIESRAMRLAFGPHAYRLCGSSVKSMIGHPQGASGAAGVAVCLLAMRDGQVPPTINLEVSDPDCDLDYVPHTARPLAIEAAVANCIAFGSKNSALCLRRTA